MSNTGDVMRDILQYCVLLVLVVVGVAPVLMMLCRSTTVREQMRAVGCSISCLTCQDCCSRSSVHYDEHDLRMLQELEEPQRPVGITGAYRMYQARRARMSLRLASWHEDVKNCKVRDDINFKLQKLHTMLAQQVRGTGPVSTTTSATSAPPASSSGGNVPFDIQIVEINDRVNEDTASETSSYVAMPETPSTRRQPPPIDLQSQDSDEEEKDEERVHAAATTVYAVV
uniref:Uncharacterized protein n=1 Tax=Globisporangium ultimum (strain ATCC 200006 / CBS 805.95 / DAOM BR144) TaxID=431595 RepID=K3WNR9_GLOUD